MDKKQSYNIHIFALIVMIIQKLFIVNEFLIMLQYCYLIVTKFNFIHILHLYLIY